MTSRDRLYADALRRQAENVRAAQANLREQTRRLGELLDGVAPPVIQQAVGGREGMQNLVEAAHES